VVFNDQSMLVEVLVRKTMAQTMQAEATARLKEQRGSQQNKQRSMLERI